MARVSIYRDPFDPGKDFVVLRPMTVSGLDVQSGESFNKQLVTTRRLRQLFDQRYLAYPHETPGQRRRTPHPRRAGLVELNEGATMRPPPTKPAPVVIPTDWQHLPWNAMSSLAAKFSRLRITNKRNAFAAIQAEVDRRARPA